MGISRGRVSYLDQEGLDHSVEVEAESLYEAVAIAVAEFRQGEIITDTPGPMTEFCVTELRKPGYAGEEENGVRLDDFLYMSDPTNDYANAQAVLDSLVGGTLPPGGPFWTAEQLGLYDKWRIDGSQP